VDNSAEAGLALYNDVGNTHLSAEGWKVDNQLNRVNIVGNDDQGGLLGLNEGDGMVEAILYKEGLLRFLRLRVRDTWGPSIMYLLLFCHQRLLVQ